MRGLSSPSFLHQSYEHETVVDPCRFTSIAVIRAPVYANAPTVNPTTTQARSTRWLVWVDKRRGLLGRTAIACPTPVDPPPGRRQSLPSPSGQRQVPLNEDDDINSDYDGRPRRSSLPLVTREVCGAATERDLTHCKHGVDYRPNDVGHVDAKRLPGWTDTIHVRPSRAARDDGQPSTGEPKSDTNIGVEEKGDVQIILRGLNRPSRVAVASGCKHDILGIFFIDHTGTTDSNRRKSSMPMLVPETGVASSNQAESRRGRLRFLRWGIGQQVLTLVERLCNPIALFVAQDSSVFVLEEVWEGSGSGFRDQDRGSRTRYRVCRLDGTRLSRWLGNDKKKRNGVEKVATAIGPRRLGLRDRNEQEGGGGSSLLVGSAVRGGLDVVTSDESETDWEISSSCASDRDINEEGAQKLHEGQHSPTGHSRRRGVVDFVEVLALPSLPVQDGNRPEQPVDFCMLADETIVIAFCRSAPLHDGQSTAEAQGVVRAFPAKPRKSTVVVDVSGGSGKSRSGLRLKDTAMSSYSSHQGWLVAEGLPVITGVAASGGSAVYASFCGAGRDGTVHAVASLSTGGRARSMGPGGIDLNAVARGRNRGAARGGGGRTGTEAWGRATRDRGGRVGARGGGGRAVRGRGNLFVPIVSGVAAALTVDKDRNLFYVTAENKGTCRALWCRLPGAGRRRVSSLRNISPVLQIAMNSSKTASKTDAVLTSASTKAGAAAAAVARDTVSGTLHSSDEGVDQDGRRFRGETILTGAAAEVEAKAVVAAKRAIALSVALTEEDEAISAGSRGRLKSLFASRTSRAPGGGERAPGREDETNGGEEEEEEADEPVNIAVVSRCRPLLAREIKRGVRAAVSCEGDEVVVSGKDLPIDRSRRFGFDRVFGPGTGQARVYGEAVAPVVRKMLDGYNCSVLAYGQTGSGKTFTMEGGLSPEQPASVEDNPNADTENMGIIPRAVHTIFREGDGRGSRRYWVYVSHMEIYNERLFDLLAQEVTADPTPISQPRTPIYRSPRYAGGRSPRTTAARSPRAISPVTTASRPDFFPGEGSRTAVPPRPVSPSSPASPQVTRGMDRGYPPSTNIAPADSPGLSDSRELGRGGGRTPAGRLIIPPRSPMGVGGERSTGGMSERGAGGRGGGGRGGGGMLGRGLTIEENPELGVMVKGLTQVEVKSPEEIFGILAKSKNNRRTAETMCNVESSRSHGVFCVRVISAEPTPWGGEITRDGRLSLVDLSGSENIKRSGAVGARAKEAAAIGQSLLALGRVIKALVRRGPHVPYRESKLTRVLGDSLGGNAFTAIILNITPNHGMLDETLNTLAYAKTAQSVENTPKQHIANKSPTEAATTGGKSTAGLPPDEVRTLSCGIAKELKRWRGAAVKAHSSTALPARAHVCPWEGKVPIRSPSQTIPPKHERQEKHSSKSVLFSSPRRLPFDNSATSERGPTTSRPRRDGSAATGDNAGRKSRPVSAGGALDGSIDDSSTANRLRRASRDGRRLLEPSSDGDVSRRGLSADGSQTISRSYFGGGGGTRSSSRRGTEAAANTIGVPYCSASQQELPSRTRRTRTAPESVGDSSKSAKRSSTQPECCPRGSSSSIDPTHRAAARVFDSTAAEWVHSAVLEPRVVCNKQRADVKSSQSGRRHGGSPIAEQDDNSSAVRRATAQQRKKKRRDRSVVFGGVHGSRFASATLTTDAQGAISEIFDRYGSHDDRDFLVSSEISELLEIWTRPEAEPPPPKGLQPARRDSSCSSTSTSAPSQAYKPAVKGSNTRRRSAAEPTLKVHEDTRSGRALTREAFLEFCRYAAVRDAIFIRHFFMRSGYNFRLEMTLALATTTASATPASARERVPAVSHGRLRRDDKRVTGAVHPRTKNSGVGSRGQQTRGESQRGDAGATESSKVNTKGGGVVGAECLLRRISSNGNNGTTTGVAETFGRLRVSPADRGAFEYRNDDDPQCMATGGIVDSAELWDWTEDERDYGERHKMGGLLSRGGGAHFSPAAATSATMTTAAPDLTNRAGNMKAISGGTAGGGYLLTPRSPRTIGHGIVDGDVSRGVVVVPSPLAIENAATETTTKNGDGGEDTPQWGARNLLHDRSKTPTTSLTTPHSIALTDTIMSIARPSGGGSAVELACSVDNSGVFRGGLSTVGQVCEWCGVIARPRALHTPAFCDEG